MNLKLEFFGDRIGPDLLSTHWMLFFKSMGRLLAKRKLAVFGNKAELRPYSTICGGKNVYIGNNVVIRPFTQIHADPSHNGEKIKIDDNVLIAPNVFITTNNHLFNDIDIPIMEQGGISKSIHIKEGAWISAGVTILSGVTVGKNSVVAAGAVVVKDVPDYCVYGGVPAKLIKQLKNDE